LGKIKILHPKKHSISHGYGTGSCSILFLEKLQIKGEQGELEFYFKKDTTASTKIFGDLGSF